jgi:hypothetical protein
VLYIESHENHEVSGLQGCDILLLGEWFIFGVALDSLTLNFEYESDPSYVWNHSPDTASPSRRLDSSALLL